MSMIVNRTDLEFNLRHVVEAEALFDAPRFEQFDWDAATAILDAAQKIAEDVYLPCASEVDQNEPHFENGQAITHPAVKPALEAFAEAGFFAAGLDEAYGGMQMPTTLQTCVNGVFACANTSVQSYAFLTIAAANMLSEFGSEAQKDLYLPKMASGEWFGTMCLSEPQAGSSLSDIKTKATPIEGDRYAISGTKMWISGGEQDMTDNIVHMVLAKIPGGPPGVKGISLFIVPKNRVSETGEILEGNNISLAGLNHKMGNKGTTNTLLNFGEKGTCEGWLVGQPHHGLAYMFHMMNEARIGVGHGATMQGLAGYLYSLDYARNRPQGRHPGEKDPESPQVNIIEHTDVKRLLLSQKCFVEGALTLVLYCAGLVDTIATSQSAEEKADLSLLLDLLTPIAKSWPSEYCLEANKQAIQILGGYGYTIDYPVERFYRDNRLNHIHEGTHAIHGLDILGRKVRMQGGKALGLLEAEIRKSIDAATSGFSDEARALESALGASLVATQEILRGPSADHQLANATLYLDAMGHLVVAWLWLKKAVLAAAQLEAGSGDSAYLSGKIRTMRYFYRYELPKAVQQIGFVSTLDTTCLEAADADF